MAGFELRGHLLGAMNPAVTDVIIANSQTLKVGDAVNLQAFSSGGGCMRADATDKVFGVCIGIVDKNGIDLDNTDTANYDGTWTSSTKTYVAAADNMTDKTVKAKVVYDRYALFYNDSAGSLAVADEFKFFDVADQDQIADQDGHDTAGAFQLMKRDPDGDSDASKGIFRIAEWEGDPYAQR